MSRLNDSVALVPKALEAEITNVTVSERGVELNGIDHMIPPVVEEIDAPIGPETKLNVPGGFAMAVVEKIALMSLVAIVLEASGMGVIVGTCPIVSVKDKSLGATPTVFVARI